MARHYVFLSLFFLFLAYLELSYALDVARIESFRRLSTSRQSNLYEAYISSTPGKRYQYPIKLLYLKGTHHEIGYDFGYIMGHRIAAVYYNFIRSIWVEDLQDVIDLPVLEEALDWKWNSNYNSHLPPEFASELQGIGEGARAARVPQDLEKIIVRINLIVTSPGNTKKYLRRIFNEYSERVLGVPMLLRAEDAAELFTPTIRRNGIFSVWGNRTLNGRLFSGHNLNWVKDSGISKEKLITFYMPSGKNTFVTTGFAGLWGIFSGMSSKGLTIQESESPSDPWTDSGLPWTLKQRYILENAASRAQAIALWNDFENTFGFNHLVCDIRGGTVLESIKGNTATLNDNEIREKQAEYENTRIGNPLPNALWRTNNGFDPVTMQRLVIPPKVNSDSVSRYQAGHNAIKDLEDKPIDIFTALGLSTKFADIGGIKCEYPNNNGTNVLSTVYGPEYDRLWVAWEDYLFANWSPAACNIYVEVDLSKLPTM